MGRRTVPLIGLACLALIGCGGGDESTEEEFGQRAESILEKTSSQFAPVAEQGAQLEPADPLPPDFKEKLAAFAGAMRDAVAELSALDPPDDAQDEIDQLIAAIETRAAAFEDAASAEDITLDEFSPVLRETGAEVDQAIAALRASGHLPEASPGE